MITFTSKAYDKCKAIVATASKEVGWFGYCTIDTEKNTVIIHDVFVPIHQKVYAAYCEVSAEGDVEVIEWEERMQQEVPNGAVIAWFHSHVNMAVFASGQDSSQFDSLRKGQQVYVRLIMNKKNDLSISISINGFVFDNITYSVENDYTNVYKNIYSQIEAYNKSITPELPKVHSTTVKSKNNSYYQSSIYDAQYMDSYSEFYDRRSKGYGAVAYHPLEPITKIKNFNDVKEFIKENEMVHVDPLMFLADLEEMCEEIVDPNFEVDMNVYISNLSDYVDSVPYLKPIDFYGFAHKTLTDFVTGDFYDKH